VKILLVLLLLSALPQGTAPSGSQAKSMAQMKRIAGTVKLSNSGISEATFTKDVTTMYLADSEIRSFYKGRGFTDDQVDKVHALSLAELRRQDPNGDIDPGVYKANAEDFGLIHIETTPEGAEVWLDGKQWSQPTSVEAFTHSGSRKIRLHKANYKDVTDTVSVTAGGSVKFNRNLESESHN
jgi:hypothetical protein